MSLSPKITVYPGTDRQQAVGIMGKASLELLVSGTSVAKFSNLQVRRSKNGNWYVQYPAEEDSKGKKDENGYPVRYPHYVLFPGDTGKDRRNQIHQQIIQECQSKIGSSPTPKAAPLTSQPTIQTAPQVPSQPADDTGLNWDLD